MEVSLSPSQPEAEKPLNAEEALKKMTELVRKAEAAVDEACKHADQYNLSFRWDLAYGMGGRYYGGTSAQGNDWETSYESGWVASSETC